MLTDLDRSSDNSPEAMWAAIPVLQHATETMGKITKRPGDFQLIDKTGEPTDLSRLANIALYYPVSDLPVSLSTLGPTPYIPYLVVSFPRPKSTGIVALRLVPQGNTVEQSLQDMKIASQSRQIAVTVGSGGLSVSRGGLIRRLNPQTGELDPDSVKTYTQVDDLVHAFGTRPVNGSPQIIGQRVGETGGLGVIRRKPRRRRAV